VADLPAARRILIEASAARFGGTAYATAALARALARRPEVREVVVVAREGSIVRRELGDAACVRWIVLAARGRGELPRRTLWQAARLRGVIRAERTDLLITISGVVPRDPGVPTLCLLGNALMYESDGLPNRLRRWAVRSTASRSGTVLAAPSSALAALIEASTGRSCITLPHGVDRSIFRPGDTDGEDVLCVADFYAHKRQDLVIAAWQRLPRPRPMLRLVGDPSVDAGVHARTSAIVAALDEPEAVEIAGLVPHRRMGELYRRASVLVVASEHESFCLPVAEAMASGVPVLARDLPSLRETAGNGGVFVAGDSPADWSRALESTLKRSAGSVPDRHTVLEASARYSWERSAERVLAATTA
jgi:glycosyltransferase involved in cell wall biosynthesis